MAVANSAVAQTTSPTSLTAAVQTAVNRGELLYIYDQAAWQGTDDLRARFSSLLSEAGGYVVSGDERQTELAFFDKAKSKAVYRATFSDGKLTSSGPPAPGRAELTPLEKQLILAKEKALNAFEEAKAGVCAEATPNLAALPPERPGGPIIVYLMTPQTDLRAYPLGGHFSVEVGQDGSVGKVRRFTNTCIDMTLDQASKGAKPVGFGITHLLDPTPTEIHVFTSLASGMPIYVGTSNKRIWAVEGSSVRTIK
jgi:hypothetical protein